MPLRPETRPPKFFVTRLNISVSWNVILLGCVYVLGAAVVKVGSGMLVAASDRRRFGRKLDEREMSTMRRHRPHCRRRNSVPQVREETP
jgi:hypothetical protein